MHTESAKIHRVIAAVNETLTDCRARTFARAHERQWGVHVHGGSDCLVLRGGENDRLVLADADLAQAALSALRRRAKVNAELTLTMLA